MNLLDEIKERAKKVTFHFNIDENGEISQYEWGDNGRNAEIWVEQRSNPTLTNVHVDRMSETHPHIKSSLEFLLQIKPEFEQAKLKFDNNPKITVREFLDSLDNNRGALPGKLYHGTSIKAAMQILKEGLKPRDLTGQDAKYYSLQSSESLRDRVYLCGRNSIGPAKFAARQAASLDKSKPVILEIDTQMIDQSLLAPDEDSRLSTWEESMNSMGSIAHIGSISADSIVLDKVLTKDLNEDNNAELDEALGL